MLKDPERCLALLPNRHLIDEALRSRGIDPHSADREKLAHEIIRSRGLEPFILHHDSRNNGSNAPIHSNAASTLQRNAGTVDFSSPMNNVPAVAGPFVAK